ncbi:pentapeptide repeat-containing protein [Streptomyces sp. NPDC086549]|uniref:caspase, EACC1-associated type n=1 Tax=Streptomyces sp. NPDC086549 TaxID=3365752 RepID=UPI003805F426
MAPRDAGGRPGGRYALLIATDRYDEPGLSRLRSPGRDAAGMAEVLRDPNIGDFQVDTVLDGRHHEVNRSMERFFLDRSANDLLLLHLSGHGIKNADGELHFAARDTDRRLLASTAVSAAFLRTQMSRCRARSIVLLLDCCYSGAFLVGSKGDTAVHIKDELAGHGRAVLTATNRVEYAWEGEHLDALAPEPSRFTGLIIEGLRSGEADTNRDGLISERDLYEYVYERLHASDARQSPQMWDEVEYRVVVAYAPAAERHLPEARQQQPVLEHGSPARTWLSDRPEPSAPARRRTRDRTAAQLERLCLPDPAERGSAVAALALLARENPCVAAEIVDGLCAYLRWAAPAGTGPLREAGVYTAVDVILHGHRSGGSTGNPSSGVVLPWLTDISLDLSGTDLSELSLDSAYMLGAGLNDATLSLSSLRHADLREADLRGADLTATDLTQADLRGADLTGVRGLTGKALARARIDGATIVPDHLISRSDGVDWTVAQRPGTAPSPLRAGLALAQTRVEAGLTLVQFAAACRLPVATLRAMERDQDTTGAHADAYLRALDVDGDSLSLPFGRGMPSGGDGAAGTHGSDRRTPPPARPDGPRERG